MKFHVVSLALGSALILSGCTNSCSQQPTEEPAPVESAPVVPSDAAAPAVMPETAPAATPETAPAPATDTTAAPATTTPPASSN